MCGDVDEDESLEGDLYTRFLLRARSRLGGSAAFADKYEKDTNRYLDGMLQRVLRLCVDEDEAALAGERYRRMAMQSLVLARLAGFLAGHVGLREDPLRKLIEAAMLGYAEAEQTGHMRDHDHGHGHDHDHGE